MTKKIIALSLALLMLLALFGCGKKQTGEEDGDSVINIGAQVLTWPASGGGTYTYEYESSTTVRITGYSGKDDLHELVVDGEIAGKTVEKIDAEAFYACSAISSLVLPEGLVEIGEYAFANCEALTSVSFPSTLKIIGKGAFYSCDTLSEAALKDTALQTVGTNAFADCAALTAVSFPGTLRTVEDIAFLNCTALESLVLPEGVTSVGAQAFYNCTGLTALTLPATLTDIGSWAFNPTARDLSDEAITVPAGSVAADYLATFRK